MMFTECDGEYYGCAADDAIINNWKEEEGKVKFSIRSFKV